MMMFVPDTSHQVTVSNFLRVAVLTWGKFPFYGVVTVSTLIREFEGAIALKDSCECPDIMVNLTKSNMSLF
jgi:hypothetical protein